jgi:hypothetical protein
MPQIQLSDAKFKIAEQRAAAEGYNSVDEYVADLVPEERAEEKDQFDVDRFFTPERLAHIDKADAMIDAGHFYTSEESMVELEKRKAAWLKGRGK